MFNPKISYGSAILSGILLLLSFPPFKFGGFLGWFALVPLFIAVYYQTRAKNVENLACVAGLGFLPVLIWFPFWFREFFGISIPALFHWILGVFLAVFTAFGIGSAMSDFFKTKTLPSKSLQYLGKVHWLQILIFPIVWTTIEFLAMNLPGIMRFGQFLGFFSIAKTQWLNPAILHLASFTGIYGVTFLVLLVNGAIAYGIIHRKETKKIFKPAIIVLCLFAIIFSYGLISVSSQKQGDVTVALIQSPGIEGEDINDLYLRLSKESLKYNPQIIAWPFMLVEGLSLDLSTIFTQEHNVYFIGPFSGEGQGGLGVVSPDGSKIYDNLGYHLVTVSRDIKDKGIKGLLFPEVHSLNTDLGNFGIVTCIESGSTLPARHRIKNGTQLLVVDTGSPNAYFFSWALGTNAIYRAAEHRMFAVEVIGDHDSSMIIDPYGRIIEDMAPEPEIVMGKISFTDERTFYTKHGDIFGWTVVGLFAALIVYNSHLKRKSPFKYCKKCRAKIKKDNEVCPKCGKRQLSFWKRTLLHNYYDIKGR